MRSQPTELPTFPPEAARLFAARSFFALIALLLVATGCGPASLGDRLAGRWVGAPDSATERELRTPSVLTKSTPAAASVAEEATASDGESPEEKEDGLGPTDLEAFEFQITLDFAPGGKLTMWRGQQQEPIDGSWRIESQNGQRAVLEITDQPPIAATEKPDENAGAERPAGQQRRFEITMEPEDAGFTLREEGADPLFGWLYFRRESAAGGPRQEPQPPAPSP